MKTILLFTSILFTSFTAHAQFSTVLFEGTDGNITIDIPEGKVFEVRNFNVGTNTQTAYLVLTKDERSVQVLQSARWDNNESNAGSPLSFAGPGSIELRPESSSTKGVLTYRIFDNKEDETIQIPRPIVKVRTICRCRWRR